MGTPKPKVPRQTIAAPIECGWISAKTKTQIKWKCRQFIGLLTLVLTDLVKLKAPLLPIHELQLSTGGSYWSWFNLALTTRVDGLFASRHLHYQLPKTFVDPPHGAGSGSSIDKLFSREDKEPWWCGTRKT